MAPVGCPQCLDTRRVTITTATGRVSIPCSACCASSASAAKRAAYARLNSIGAAGARKPIQ